jgi:hypothetical protein
MEKDKHVDFPGEKEYRDSMLKPLEDKIKELESDKKILENQLSEKDMIIRANGYPAKMIRSAAMVALEETREENNKLRKALYLTEDLLSHDWEKLKEKYPSEARMALVTACEKMKEDGEWMYKPPHELADLVFNNQLPNIYSGPNSWADDWERHRRKFYIISAIKKATETGGVIIWQ